ncbi:MAG TPA: DnaA regulatory inactivator Hda [Oceanospirillales bacterium]|nr:DnaA regulatory inactivator Hda [Oceanospirillaceae bacterium]HBS42417.1 DnaA regulatory inactivator Hda [Oceanospirillales bacterium]|tara:strand:+ start:1641 stop:2339 length:699 start_codon:yes stop_codon:yes gene_type:complete
MSFHPQLTLAVTSPEDARFDNFYAGPNTQLVRALKSQWTTAGTPFIYLWGTEGSGRSHLLQAACQYAQSLGHQSMYIPLQDFCEHPAAVIDGVEQLPLVALDNLDRIPPGSDWEERLFHLFNRLQDQQGHLLVTASVAPAQLDIQLADLKSRMSSGVVFQLQPLSDQEKAAALILRAGDRGIQLSDDVAHYLLSRGPRDMAGLTELLQTLDQASLRAQRRLTIPFVREELGW